MCAGAYAADADACKTIAITRVYGGADLLAEHCLPVKRSRNETTHRSGRLVSASTSSSTAAFPSRRERERALAVEPSYNSPGIMFKYYRVGHTPATILSCTRGILQFPHASSRLRLPWQIWTRFFSKLIGVSVTASFFSNLTYLYLQFTAFIISSSHEIANSCKMCVKSNVLRYIRLRLNWYR